jgi:DNA-binding MarR family transcriptional regulator
MAKIAIQEVACGDGENEPLLRVVFQFFYFPGCGKSEEELRDSLNLTGSTVMEALRRLEEDGFITSRLEKIDKENSLRETVRMYRLTKRVTIIITNESDK